MRLLEGGVDIGSADRERARFQLVESLEEHGSIDSGRAFRIGGSGEGNQANAVGGTGVDEFAEEKFGRVHAGEAVGIVGPHGAGDIEEDDKIFGGLFVFVKFSSTGGAQRGEESQDESGEKRDGENATA